jgi:N-acetylglucosaminyldiphosphoundecaprenol N-acetyl-beta-D-mannosaminyltransferase
MRHNDLKTTSVLDVPYVELDYSGAAEVITDWAVDCKSETVVVAPVSSLIMSKKNPKLRHAFDRASMITSDGMPIVWMRKLMGRQDATRLYGPDLMKVVCIECADRGIRVGLIGGHPERIGALKDELSRIAPGIEIVYDFSPPFRSLGDYEIRKIAHDTMDAGCGVIFVGLGCPKQEIFMQCMRPHFNGVQIGVGAAFDFIPGFVRQSPAILQRMGLEWAFRIACEPKRLWRRYATTIPPFVWGAMIQLIAHHVGGQKQENGVTA